MRYCLLTLVVAASAFAQGHQIPTLNSCIREFYDPGMYNYLTFQNNCTHSLTLVFVAKDGSGAGGKMDLRPGGKDSVGKMGKRSPKVGDFQFYVCQSGELPIGEDGKVVSKPGANFRCQGK